MFRQFALALSAAWLMAAPALAGNGGDRLLTLPAHGDGLASAMREAESEDLEVLYFEDFSLLTQGSEENPDRSVDIGHNWWTGAPYFDEGYFHAPGWGGCNIFPAGGMMWVWRNSTLNSPEGDYHGRIIVTFKAKSNGGYMDFWGSIMQGGQSDCTRAAIEGYAQENIHSDDGWVEYRWEFTNPLTRTDCFLQMNFTTYDEPTSDAYGLVVDDLCIMRDRNFVISPSSASFDGFTADSFHARWNEVPGADGYLVNLYSLSPTGEPPTEASIDFEDIDAANPQFGEYVTVETQENPIDVESGVDGSKCVVLQKEDDSIYVTAPEGAAFDSFGFDLAGDFTAIQEEEYGQVNVYAYDGKEWVSFGFSLLANMDLAYSHKQLEGLDGKYKALRLQSRLMQEGDRIFVDNIHFISTAPERETVEISDMAVTSNEYTFSIPDPDYDYYLDVRAVKGDLLSAPSDRFFAFGIMAPTAQPATDIDRRGAFSANWTPVAKASGYNVNIYDVVTMTADQTGYPVVEDDFGRPSTSATPEEPEYVDYDFLTEEYAYFDEFTCMPGWHATGYGAIVANGMIGCDNGITPYGVEYYTLYSPMFSLDNASGVYTVEGDVWSEAGSVFAVQDKKSYGRVDFDQTGLKHFKVELTDGLLETRLMFYTATGHKFLLDNLKVSQNLKKNDRLHYLSGTAVVEAGSTSTRFTGLSFSEDRGYAYNVEAIYSKFGKDTRSDKSNIVYVDPGSGVDDISAYAGNPVVVSLKGAISVDVAEDCEVEVFDISGMMVDRRSVGNGGCVIGLTPGMYVVRIGNHTFKTVVK